MDDGVLLDKAKAASALGISLGDLLAALKTSPEVEITRPGRIQGKVRRVAKIPAHLMTEEAIQRLSNGNYINQTYINLCQFSNLLYLLRLKEKGNECKNFSDHLHYFLILQAPRQQQTNKGQEWILCQRQIPPPSAL